MNLLTQGQPYAVGTNYLRLRTPVTIGMAEGATADAEGNVYGAGFLGDVRKFGKK